MAVSISTGFWTLRKIWPKRMENTGEIALSGVLASQEPENVGNEPAHEPIYRQMCARYEVEHRTPATSWRRYLLYEQARSVALASSCQQKRQSRLPQRLVHQPMAAIDDSCQRSSARKHWKKKEEHDPVGPFAQRRVKTGNQEKASKKIKLGVIRAGSSQLYVFCACARRSL